MLNLRGRNVDQTTARDVHGRKWMEKDLSDIFEDAAVGLQLLGPDGRILRVNRIGLRLLGYSHEEYVGHLITEFHADQENARKITERLCKGEELRDCEARLRCKDGTIKQVLIGSIPSWRNGRLLHALCLTMDITPYKRNERRLAVQNAVTQALAESIAIAEASPKILQAICEVLDWDCGLFWSIDPKTDALRCADVWQRPSGGMECFEAASRQVTFPQGIDLPGRAWLERGPVWIEDVGQEKDFARSPFSTQCGLRSALTFPIRCRDKILGVIELFSREVRRPDDELRLTMTSMGSQVGQFVARKRAEEELSRSEEQFRQSQKMEAVGRLAGGVAHDFNNLLTVILGHCKFLESSLDPSDSRREELQQITDASKRAAALTHELLAFSRRQVLAPKVINPNAVIESMEKMLRPIIGEDIQFAVVLEKDLGDVKADEGQMGQVLMNLVVNARDAMPQGGKITLETKKVVLSEESPGAHDVIPPGAYAMIVVSDTGCGMDAETLSHIFEPFFTTKVQGKGTGLGLSTVFGIVKQSGGYIRVYSEPKWGSAFKIYLPLSSEAAEPRFDAPAQTRLLRGSENILIVEDEAAVRQLLVRILRTNGYAAWEACGGIDAMQLVEHRGREIDLILTDVVMPELGGHGLADYVQSTHPHIKFIFMSGYTNDAVIRHGHIDPGTAFLQKPVTADMLLRKIRQVLDARENGNGLPASNEQHPSARVEREDGKNNP